MLHCLIKLSDTLKLKHSLVRPAVSVQVPTATTRSSQCGTNLLLSGVPTSMTLNDFESKE